MNPVLIILIFIAAALLWLVGSFVFIPLGNLVLHLINNAIEKMRDKKEVKDDENVHE